ncbi:MAG TPA: hypothetical protein VNZ49_09730 [Bacteroidia bacterium]|jgi:hypothetical protein|nr:hypothetical protein [Bacteroidia bacterium]
MKKTLLTLTVSTLIIGAGLTGCNTPVEKIEKAQENVTESKAALEKVEADYTTDMVKFRKNSDERIAANQKNLDEFNEQIAKEKKVAKTEYKRKITELEKKNSDMKKRMDDYKAEGKENWEKFKTEFNRDMEELGEAFKGLTTKKNK